MATPPPAPLPSSPSIGCERCEPTDVAPLSWMWIRILSWSERETTEEPQRMAEAILGFRRPATLAHAVRTDGRRGGFQGRTCADAIAGRSQPGEGQHAVA